MKNRFIKRGKQNQGYYILVTGRWYHKPYFAWLAVRYGLPKWLGRKLVRFGMRLLTW